MLMYFLPQFRWRDQKVSMQEPKASYSQTTNSPAFDCGKNQSRDRKEDGNESEDGGTRRRRSVFASGGGRRLMLACNLEVICGRM